MDDDGDGVVAIRFGGGGVVVDSLLLFLGLLLGFTVGLLDLGVSFALVSFVGLFLGVASNCTFNPSGLKH